MVYTYIVYDIYHVYSISLPTDLLSNINVTKYSKHVLCVSVHVHFDFTSQHKTKVFMHADRIFQIIKLHTLATFVTCIFQITLHKFFINL